MGAFSHARRDAFRPLRDGKIIIYFNWLAFVIGFLTLALGTGVRIVTNKFANTSVELYEQGCPVNGGVIQTWTRDFGNFLIVIGLALLARSGFIPCIYKGVGLRDEAICCGKIFMTLFGSVIIGLLVASLTILNMYGSFVISQTEGIDGGVQHEERWPLEKAITYCAKPMWILTKVLNYGEYTVVGLVILAFMIKLFLKVRVKKKDLIVTEQQLQEKQRPRSHRRRDID